MSADAVVGASFRDPAGFVFEREGTLLRQVNLEYRPHFERLQSSGLLAKLWEEGLLVDHEEVDAPPAAPEVAWKVLRPRRVGFVSYPWEWCFEQLQDAALATLRIQELALARGMTLKDAAAPNAQFHAGRPVHIDSLSFEVLPEAAPWVAYGQFCRHFLAPLALSRVDARLAALSRNHVDGIPLDLASRTLPATSWLSFGLLVHLHLHARFESRASGPVSPKGRRFSQSSLSGLIASLASTCRSLRSRSPATVWGGYQPEGSYSAAALAQKRDTVTRMLERARPATVWDLGANTGEFSRIAAGVAAEVVALDGDPAAVQAHYRALKARDERRVLPLLVDLANPTGAQGWAHAEHRSLQSRGPCDLAMALALVHHLAIGNQVPLPRLADWLASIARRVILEFVPREDPQVVQLLATRPGAFPDYQPAAFEAAMRQRFEVEDRVPLEGSGRVLYLLRRLRG
ncbi:MAG: hypothetical protein QM765_35025 [Myxococcales bacterium]